MKTFMWTVLCTVLFASQALPVAGQDGGTSAQTGNLAARYPVTGVGLGIAGSIDEMTIDDPTYFWSGGTITIAGVRVIIPENLLIDLPANRLTLWQLFDQAPEPAKSLGKSGLATNDYDGGFTGIGTAIANRSAFGNYIAGELVIDKNTEEMQGQVTYIDHTDGYFLVNGVAGDPTTGKMVRLNDPPARHSKQQGLGCLPGAENCSPDVRFGGDPDNYTVVFVTGYPAAIPSTLDGADATTGAGDPFAPQTNRPNGVSVTVADSTRFAPLMVGDNIIAAGNFEEIGGAQFLSAHTFIVEDALFTDSVLDPTQPDYLTWEEVEWDAPNFANLRVKCLYIGFNTTRSAEIDCFSLHIDPETGENTERLFGTTVGNPTTQAVGVAPHAGGAFKINFDIDFIDPPFAGVNAKRAPCPNLLAGGVLIPDPTGFGPNGINDGGMDPLNPGTFLGDDGPIGGQMVSPCPRGGLTIDENISLLTPNCREMIGRSRRKTADLAGAGLDGLLGTGDDTPGVESIVVLDKSGNLATWGEYLTPVGFGHPEMGEIDMGGWAQPHIFTGAPWLLDRRLGTGGHGEEFPPVSPAVLGQELGTGTDPNTLKGFQLNPFPLSGLDPIGFLGRFTNLVGENVGTAQEGLLNQPFSFFPFGPNDFLTPGNIAMAPPSIPIAPLPEVGAPAPPGPAVADITTNVAGPFDLNDPEAMRTVVFTAVAVPVDSINVGPATGFTWEFGDGQIGTGNPVSHTFATAGTFTASVVASGPGGTSALFTDDVSFDVIGMAPFDPPVAAFVPSSTTGLAPLTVSFQDVSDLASGPGASITSRTWDFGDGTAAETYATATNPVHIFALPSMPGQYTVTLTVVGMGGGMDSTSALITVTAPPAPVATLSALAGGVTPAAGVQQLTVNFTDSSSGTISSRTLNFGDGTAAVTSMGAPAAPLSTTHTYVAAGTFTATLTVENLGGSSNSSQTIVVDPFLSEVRIQPRGGNVGRIRARNTNGVAVSAELDFGDGTAVNTTLPPFQILHQYPNAGTFTVTLTTADLFGNISTTTSTAVIN